MTDNHAHEYFKVIELNIVGFWPLKGAMLDKLTKKKKNAEIQFLQGSLCGIEFKTLFLTFIGHLYVIVYTYILSPFNCGSFLLLLMTIIRLNPHLVDHFPPRCGACVMRSKQSNQPSNVPSLGVWKFTPMFYRTSALWGPCPTLIPLLHWIIPSGASGTADHV